MTTLEPEQKDILEKLNEVALAENWGTVDRVHTAECPNGIPKGVAVIMEAIEEIKRLREQNGELYAFKRKLEDELIEQGFAEYADEEFKTLSDYKNAVKAILQKWYEDIVKGLGEDGSYIKEIAKEYGVEIDNE